MAFDRPLEINCNVLTCREIWHWVSTFGQRENYARESQISLWVNCHSDARSYKFSLDILPDRMEISVYVVDEWC